jgi:hypothetical protein
VGKPKPIRRTLRIWRSCRGVKRRCESPSDCVRIPRAVAVNPIRAERGHIELSHTALRQPPRTRPAELVERLLFTTMLFRWVFDHAEGLTNGRKARSGPVPQTVLRLLAKQCEGRELDELVFGDGTNYLPRLRGTAAGLLAPLSGRGAEDHAPRSLAYVRQPGDQRRGERACAGADARQHRSLGDAFCVRRLVRHRPRCRSGCS